jgi:hypothetical protein
MRVLESRLGHGILEIQSDSIRLIQAHDSRLRQGGAQIDANLHYPVYRFSGNRANLDY